MARKPQTKKTVSAKSTAKDENPGVVEKQTEVQVEAQAEALAAEPSVKAPASEETVTPAITSADTASASARPGETVAVDTELEMSADEFKEQLAEFCKFSGIQFSCADHKGSVIKRPVDAEDIIAFDIEDGTNNVRFVLADGTKHGVAL
jgi:hypothetical protein